jgi:hypothetical protein
MRVGRTLQMRAGCKDGKPVNSELMLTDFLSITLSEGVFQVTELRWLQQNVVQ